MNCEHFKELNRSIKQGMQLHGRACIERSVARAIPKWAFAMQIAPLPNVLSLCNFELATCLKRMVRDVM